MIITLSSINPLFSFLIGKNPTGIPIVRPLRSGTLIGWFPEINDSIDTQKYVIYFYDNPDICSFQSIEGSNEAKYVNVGQYSSPLIVTSVISEILSSTIKKLDTERDTSYTQTIHFSGLLIKNIKLYQCIRDTFPDVVFDCKHLVGFMYELTLTYTGTLFDLMNIVSLMAILLSLGNKETISLDDNTIEKYARHISRATTNKAQYDGWYLRYIFKKRAKLNKKQLSLLETPRLTMTYGNTSDARADFIWLNLKDVNMDFLDVGCNTDLLIRRMIHKKWANKFVDLPYNYYLVDADPAVQERLINKGLLCYESVDSFYENNPDFDGAVVMTEVIEHNEEADAVLLVDTILSHRARQIYITTPNYHFNQFFNNNGFRHDDHHWEMTFVQFQEWINNIVVDGDHPYDVKVIGVGDCIDTIPITSGAILTLK